MRLMIYVAAVAVACLLPVKRTDIGSLQPVEVVSVSTEQGDLLIETDTGDYGKGNTLEETIANLIETTPAVIYLDTAEYLLVDSDSLKWIGEMKKYLKDDVRIYRNDGVKELSGVAAFLDVRKGGTELWKWSDAQGLDSLAQTDERLILKKQ